MLSFACHIALAATFTAAALATSSLAQASENSRTPTQERALAAQAGGDFQAQAKPGRPKVWAAVVSETGSGLARGAATGASNLGVGSFQVDFPVDVSNCVYVANQGTTDVSAQPDGTATTARPARACPRRFSSRPTTAPARPPTRSFHLAAICP